MAALEVIQSNLIQQAKAPLTSSTGGTSKGNPSAGTGDTSAQDPIAAKPATTGDRVGAGFLTAVVASIVLIGLVWVSMPDKSVQ
jgi:mannan endo-1,6-alpha-mannosidase